MNKQSQTFHYYYYVSIFRVVSFNTFGNFYGFEIWHEIFWVLNFGLGVFWILFKALGIFGVSFLPPFNHPCHLKSRVPPPPPIQG